MHTTNLQDYRWFRRHGHNVRDAFHYARAEKWAADEGITFAWVADEGYDVSHLDCIDRRGRCTQGHEHEVLVLVARNADGDVIDSLSGIVDADQAYGRQCEAEMAYAAMTDGDDCRNMEAL